MKLKTLFIGLPLLAGIMFGGAKGYIYYHVSNELDRTILLASPYAEARYQGISSSFKGRITIEKISIYPAGSNDEITIESAQIQGNGLPFLYQLVTGSFQNTPPEKFGFSVNGLSIPLNGDLAANYTRMLESARQASGVKEPDGCGLLTGLSPDLMGALGFYAITMDTSLDVDFDPAAGQARIQMGFDIRDVEHSQISMLLTHLPPPGVISMGMQKPQLSKMTVTFQVDPGFVAKAQQHCAESRKLTVDAFIESMLNMDEAQLAQQLGFKPGPGLVAAIKSFIKNPNEVSFTIHPPESIDPASLSFYKPEELPQLLDLELSINGEPVTDLSFNMLNSPGTGETGLASQLPTPQTIFSPGAKRLKQLRKQAPARDYIPTPITQLHNHIDANVRVYVDQENALRKGVLVSITQNQITLKQRLSGGDMTVEVPLKQISKVEVYRLP